ncbi:MAG: hypothetical protein JW839_23025 [Candidatus Lokiarchaeota archaeon]|nr:hypothetical protein [Candidatus Lokiarchaeota archaeon]
MADQNPISKFFNGTFSRNTMLTRLVPLILAVMLVTLFIAALMFPTAYDWRYLVISALLSTEDNPFWNAFPALGMTVGGVLMIGFLGYYQKRLGKICRGTAGVGTAFVLVAIIGLIGVGTVGQAGELIPEFHAILEDAGLEKLHEYLAALGFLGVVFAAIFYSCPVLKDRFQGAKQFNMRTFLAGLVPILVGVAGLALSSLFNALVDWPEAMGNPANPAIEDAGKYPAWISFAFWEWILFVGVVVYIVLLAVLVPESVIPFERRGREKKP